MAPESTSLTDSLTDGLGKQIVNGGYSPGDQLCEAMIASRFASPVRRRRQRSTDSLTKASCGEEPVATSSSSTLVRRHHRPVLEPRAHRIQRRHRACSPISGTPAEGALALMRVTAEQKGAPTTPPPTSHFTAPSSPLLATLTQRRMAILDAVRTGEHRGYAPSVRSPVAT